MDVTLQMYLIVCPLVFLASLIDAIGGGGGLISLPAYLLAGLDPHLASGSNKLSASIGSFTAAVTFFKKGKLLLIPSLCAVAGALPGSYLGAELLKITSENIVQIMMVIMMPLVALFIVFKGNKIPAARKVSKKTYALCFLSGLIVGAYDGFFGPGAGTFYILFFTWLCGMDMVNASGSAKPVNFASNIGSLVSHIIGGRVVYALALPAMAFSMLGGFIGSRLAILKGAKFIRYAMLVVVGGIMIKLIVEWFI